MASSADTAPTTSTNTIPMIAKHPTAFIEWILPSKYVNDDRVRYSVPRYKIALWLTIWFYKRVIWALLFLLLLLLTPNHRYQFSILPDWGNKHSDEKTYNDNSNTYPSTDDGESQVNECQCPNDGSQNFHDDMLLQKFHALCRERKVQKPLYQGL